MATIESTQTNDFYEENLDNNGGLYSFNSTIESINSIGDQNQTTGTENKENKDEIQWFYYYSTGANFLDRLPEAPTTEEIKHFELGGHKSTTNGFQNLDNTRKNSENFIGDIYIAFGSGTDGTEMEQQGQYNEEEFEKKRKEIIDFVSKSKLNKDNKDRIIQLVSECDLGTRGPNKGLYNNEWLLGMRNLECIKQIVESYNKSNLNPEKARLILGYYSKLNQPGTTEDKVEERFTSIKVRQIAPKDTLGLDGYRDNRRDMREK